MLGFAVLRLDAPACAPVEDEAEAIALLHPVARQAFEDAVATADEATAVYPRLDDGPWKRAILKKLEAAVRADPRTTAWIEQSYVLNAALAHDLYFEHLAGRLDDGLTGLNGQMLDGKSFYPAEPGRISRIDFHMGGRLTCIERSDRIDERRPVTTHGAYQLRWLRREGKVVRQSVWIELAKNGVTYELERTPGEPEYTLTSQLARFTSLRPRRDA